MIIFYTNRSGGAIVEKVSILLNELSIPYTSIPIDLQSENDEKKELEKINPNLNVPAIVDKETGISLFESSAILYYLASKTGEFLPEQLTERSEVMKWLIFEASSIAPMMLELYYYILKSPYEISELHLQRYKTNIESYCHILDDRLKTRDYICDNYSIADINIYPWSTLFVDLADVDLSKFLHLSSWITRISSRFAVKSSK